MVKRILLGVIFAFWATNTALALPDINQINPLPATTELDPAQIAHIQQTYGKLPLFFIQNDGQLDKQVKFYEKGSGHAPTLQPKV